MNDHVAWFMMYVNLAINVVVLARLASSARHKWDIWSMKMRDLFYALAGWCVLNFVRTIKNLIQHRNPTEFDLIVIILTTLMLMFTLRGLRRKGDYTK